jgi:hypothetical protein
MADKHKIKSDERLNPQLKEEVQTLRGVINIGQGSNRFTTARSEDTPGVIITDLHTGRTTTSPLFAASNVMDALKELFPDN